MGRKRMIEVRPLLSLTERTFFEKEKLRFATRSIKGKDDWTMDDLLEHIVVEKLQNKKYLSLQQKWLRRSFSIHDSTFIGDLSNEKWQPERLPEEYRRLSVRFHMDWNEVLKRFAYALDIRPAEAVRKILSDFFHEATSEQTSGDYLYVVNEWRGL